MEGSRRSERWKEVDVWNRGGKQTFGRVEGSRRLEGWREVDVWKCGGN